MRNQSAECGKWEILPFQLSSCQARLVVHRRQQERLATKMTVMKTIPTVDLKTSSVTSSQGSQRLSTTSFLLGGALYAAQAAARATHGHGPARDRYRRARAPRPRKRDGPFRRARENVRGATPRPPDIGSAPRAVWPDFKPTRAALARRSRFPNRHADPTPTLPNPPVHHSHVVLDLHGDAVPVINYKKLKRSLDASAPSAGHGRNGNGGAARDPMMVGKDAPPAPGAAAAARMGGGLAPGDGSGNHMAAVIRRIEGFYSAPRCDDSDDDEGENGEGGDGDANNENNSCGNNQQTDAASSDDEDFVDDGRDPNDPEVIAAKAFRRHQKEEEKRAKALLPGGATKQKQPEEWYDMDDDFIDDDEVCLSKNVPFPKSRHTVYRPRFSALQLTYGRSCGCTTAGYTSVSGPVVN
jgi:hypothetical protein